MHVYRFLLISLLALTSLSSVSSAQEPTPRWQSRDELEAHSRDLDHRVIELQHAAMAARHENDAEALKRAEEKLKSLQDERVDTLHTLGHLP